MQAQAVTEVETAVKQVSSEPVVDTTESPFDEALTQLREQCCCADFKVALQTIIMTAQRIMDNCNVSKFRTIKAIHPAFVERLGRHGAAAEQCLLLMGFRLEPCKIIFDPTDMNWNKLKLAAQTMNARQDLLQGTAMSATHQASKERQIKPAISTDEEKVPNKASEEAQNDENIKENVESSKRVAHSKKALAKTEGTERPVKKAQVEAAAKQVQAEAARRKIGIAASNSQAKKVEAETATEKRAKLKAAPKKVDAEAAIKKMAGITAEIEASKKTAEVTAKRDAAAKKEKTARVAKAKKETMALPTEAVCASIVCSVANNRVTVIRGEPGCGKSSRVPFILLADYKSGKPRIFVTAQHRIAARGLHRYLQNSRNSQKCVGSCMRGESTNQNAEVVFATTGWLVQKLLKRDEGKEIDITHIIIDECHERTVETDMPCWLARQLLRDGNQLRVVLMSATMHTQIYTEYFAEFGDVPCINIDSMRHSVDCRYLDSVHNALHRVHTEHSNWPSQNRLDPFVEKHVTNMVERGACSGAWSNCCGVREWHRGDYDII